MLTNATIIRVDQQTGHTATGRAIFTQGASIQVRCFMDQVSSRQRQQLGAVIADADQVCFVRDASFTPANGDVLVFMTDRSEALHYGVCVTLGDRMMPGAARLTHYEIFLRLVKEAEL